MKRILERDQPGKESGLATRAFDPFVEATRLMHRENLFHRSWPVIPRPNALDSTLRRHGVLRVVHSCELHWQGPRGPSRSAALMIEWGDEAMTLLADSAPVRSSAIGLRLLGPLLTGWMPGRLEGRRRLRVGPLEIKVKLRERSDLAALATLAGTEVGTN